MKDIILTAIILILLGLTVRHLRYEPKACKDVTPHVIQMQDGYYRIHPASSTEIESSWIVESKGIDAERVEFLKTHLSVSGFKVQDFEGTIFWGVSKRGADISDLVREIETER